jgi:coronin-1B/1C/6
MERELMLWDSKKLDAPISCTTLDQGSGVIYPVYDDQLGVLYLTGKGDSSIKYMEFQEGGLHYLNTYTSTVSGKVYNILISRDMHSSLREMWMSLNVKS